jgi:hypothetical protein
VALAVTLFIESPIMGLERALRRWVKHNLLFHILIVLCLLIINYMQL